MIRRTCANAASGALGYFTDCDYDLLLIFNVLELENEAGAAKYASFVFALESCLSSVQSFGSDGSDQAIHTNQLSKPDAIGLTVWLAGPMAVFRGVSLHVARGG